MMVMMEAQSCILLTIIMVISLTIVSANNGVFSVKYKYAGRQRSLSDLKAHDDQRQLRILTGVDLPLGGTGRPDTLGLYYAKIGIGTPSKDYYVQVDTGSDIMWVNCIQCRECPRTSSLGIDLTLYNIKDSDTGKLVPCDQEFCYEINGGPLSGCIANMSCPYLEIYGDGSSTAGYFVKDVVQYARVSGDLKTTAANGSVIFGCGARQSGDLGSSNEEALDGILGFGKSNSSMISQLAATGKVEKIFAHCLDGTNGGGIFAIGHVVQPKVNMTPLIPNQPHYNVNMTAVQVGRDFLKLPTDVFEAGDRKGAIIDSGTTLAYLPEMVYELLVSKIISQQPDLKVHTVHDEYKCFQYSGRYSIQNDRSRAFGENLLTHCIHRRLGDNLFSKKKNKYSEAKCSWTGSGIASGIPLTILRPVDYKFLTTSHLYGSLKHLSSSMCGCYIVLRLLNLASAFCEDKSGVEKSYSITELPSLTESVTNILPNPTLLGTSKLSA
ncbi:unnamed protein product [Dovyalis caffra]|uniref:Peptidase A1 domain-containing protein n=1 Tax=Dovyalis caffra TaxID=77055 RepID=A0AAV1SD66_9ROSI|nr:unnamed protein product [Dovyalis caffra]